MAKKRAHRPAMQDLSDYSSLVAQAFKRLAPPVGPFDPDGVWTHVYTDISTFSFKHVQGGLTLRHKAGGMLRIEGSRRCPDGYHYFTTADLQCGDDALRTPTSWKVESKVSKKANGKAYLNSGFVKHAEVKGGVLSLKEGSRRRTVKVSGRCIPKRCLLDTVGRMARLGTQEIAFTLIDEYDEPCGAQVIKLRGKSKAKTRSGTIDISCYQHTGIATIPGVYYVDNAGRVLFYVTGMELLALASVDGKGTGY